MTKLPYIFSFFIFAAIACKSTDTSEAGNTEKITSIEVDAITRGYKEEIKLSPEKFTFLSTKEKLSKTIDNKQWEKILDALDAIEIKNISTFEAPTQKRFHDGDLSTTITINTIDSTYTSRSFDKQTPPAELKELMSIVYELK